ncbi:MAG: Uma2 family endonuclease [Bacteroidia bacterium]
MLHHITINMGEHKLSVYQQVTPEEYLQMEEKNEFRSEYVYGEVFAMAGASMNHVTACLNLSFSLRTQLKGKKCRTLMSDTRVKLAEGNIYYYPDVVVTCSEKDLKDGKSVSEPTLLIKVLSGSTMEKDLNEKLQHYLAIPTLEYYMVVSQYKISIILYVRTDIGWGVLLYHAANEVITLEKIGVMIKVEDIYEGIDWEI